MGPAMFGESMIAGLGLPAPAALGWIVTLIELVGGLALIIGLATRPLLGIVLAGATVLVKPDLGIIAPMGSQLQRAQPGLALLAGLLAVAVLGPGRPSTTAWRSSGSSPLWRPPTITGSASRPDPAA